MSYFDCFTESGQAFTFEPPDLATQQELEPAPAEAPGADMSELATFSDTQETDSDGWSYRNEDVGVGAIMNPEGTEWQDMVWVDWN